jgi:hypothetical protein
MTGSGLIWLDEMADLMMLNAPDKGSVDQQENADDPSI